MEHSGLALKTLMNSLSGGKEQPSNLCVLNWRAKMIPFVHQWLSKVAAQSATEVSTTHEPLRQWLFQTVPVRMSSGTLNKTHTQKNLALKIISWKNTQGLSRGDVRAEIWWMHSFVVGPISTVHGANIYKFMSLETEPNTQPSQAKPNTELVANV